MRYRFGECLLDTDRRELLRNDQLVQIGPLPFDLLTFLIRNRDRVVTKDDLLKSIWSGRTVTDSTLISHLKAARTAIGDSGEEQQWIRTLNRKGFRFIGEVEEIAPQETLPESPLKIADEPAEQSTDRSIEIGTPPSLHRKTLIIGAAAATFAIVGAVLAFSLWPQAPFDPSQVPLVGDAGRRELANYGSRPKHKAIAITAARAYIADNEASREAAVKAAVALCEARNQTRRAPCVLYANGNDIVLPQAFPIAAADIRTTPLAPLDVDKLTFASENFRSSLRNCNRQRGLSRIIFVSVTGQMYRSLQSTNAEAARIGLDVCQYLWRKACFVVAVDENLTVELPQSRKIVGFFLPSSDAEISSAQRGSVVESYAVAAWRAAAKGAKGWHAVGGAKDEASAIDEAMKKCRNVDDSCRLVAIGNFRVAGE